MGQSPRIASSCAGHRAEAKPPPCFGLNEATTHGEMASKTNSVASEQETVALKTVEHAQ